MTRITQGEGNNEEPAFSPNGRAIAFARAGQGVFIANADGSGKAIKVWSRLGDRRGLGPGAQGLSARMRGARLLDVPVIGQRNGHECGPTSLAAVARYLGREIALADLARLAGTTPDGTDHDNLIAAAVAIGATVFAKDRGLLAEVARFIGWGLPVIAGWWSMSPGDDHFDARWTLDDRRANDRGHYAVIRGFTPTELALVDPEAGDDGRTIGACTMPDALFEAVWYDTDTARYEKVERWYMVANFDGRRFADEVAGGRDHAGGPEAAGGEGEQDRDLGRYVEVVT